MNHIHDYSSTGADWREQIRINQRRTRLVIAMFILIYIAVGLLIDIVLQCSKTFSYEGAAIHLSVSQAFYGLITFKLFPTATVVTTIIAIVSLFITYAFYDKIMLLGTEYQEITPETASSLQEKQLYNVIEEMKVAAGLRYMPKVYIINANYMNAFASGYSEKSAMIAVTRGLLEKLDRSELQAVVAHELSHIRHLDIKLTLTASVLANLMLMAVDLLFWNLMFTRSSEDRRDGNWLFFAVYLLRIILPIVTMVLILYLSRTREYMADAGAVELMRDNEPMARALLKIQQDYEGNADNYQREVRSTAHENVRQAAYLYDPSQAGLTGADLSNMFSTHPSIQKRLEAIGFKLKQ